VINVSPSRSLPKPQSPQTNGNSDQLQEPQKNFTVDSNIGCGQEAPDVVGVYCRVGHVLISVEKNGMNRIEVVGGAYSGPRFEPVMVEQLADLIGSFGETVLMICSPDHNSVRRAAWSEWRRIKSQLGEQRFYEVWHPSALDLKRQSALSAELRKMAVSIARNPGMLFSVAADSTLETKQSVAHRYASTVPGEDMVAPSTASRYARAYGKAVFPYWAAEDWADWTVSTRRNNLSALRFCLRGRILSYFSDLRMPITDPYDRILRNAIVDLRLGQILLELSWLEVWAMRIGDERKPRHNRKHDLEGLPENWTDIVFVSIGKRAKWRLSAAVMAVFGARPSEMAKGVRLDLNGPEQTITATIRGSKVTEKNGHRERSITLVFDQTNAMIALIAACRAGGGQVVVQPPNSKNFTSGLNGRIKAVFPYRNLSLYHFRHQFASNAKAPAASGATIARAMGHRSTRTQGGYGSKSTGRTPTENLKAEGSEPLREKTRQKPWDLRKQQEVEKRPPGPDDLSNMPKP
jgi:integrase